MIIQLNCKKSLPILYTIFTSFFFIFLFHSGTTFSKTTLREKVVEGISVKNFVHSFTLWFCCYSKLNKKYQTPRDEFHTFLWNFFLHSPPTTYHLSCHIGVCVWCYQVFVSLFLCISVYFCGFLWISVDFQRFLRFRQKSATQTKHTTGVRNAPLKVHFFVSQSIARKKTYEKCSCFFYLEHKKYSHTTEKHSLCTEFDWLFRGIFFNFFEYSRH